MSNTTFWTGHKEGVPKISIDTSKLLFVKHLTVEQPTLRGTNKSVPGVEIHFINGEVLTLVTHVDVDGLIGFYDLIGTPELDFANPGSNSTPPVESDSIQPA